MLPRISPRHPCAANASLTLLVCYAVLPNAQASLRQVEARAEELKAAAQGHEARAAEAAAELAKAKTSLERLGVGAWQWCTLIQELQAVAGRPAGWWLAGCAGTPDVQTIASQSQHGVCRWVHQRCSPLLLPPLVQNELQLQKEKVKRKAAIVARQEEELAARDAAADEALQRARGLQRDLERATEDAGVGGLRVCGWWQR